MPINPNIALSIQPVQPINMLGTAAQAIALKAAMQDIQGGEALRNVFAQGGDINDPTVQRQIMAANPKAGADIIKKQADIRKTQIDTLKDELAIRRDALSGVSTPEDYLAWHRANHSGQMGQFLNSIGIKQKSDAELLAEITKPGGLQKAIQASALGATKLQQELMQTERTLKSAQISAGPGYMQARTSQERLQFEKSKPIGQQVGADGVLYNLYADGTAKPVQMGGAPVVASTEAPATGGAPAPVNNLAPTATPAAPVNAMVQTPAGAPAMPGATPTAVAPTGGFKPMPTQSAVNISMGPQESAFQQKLGQGQADQILANRVAAQDAASIIKTNQIGRDILNSGAITGAGANFIVGFDQALRTMGVNLGSDASANSQAYVAAMAQNTGKLIKQFGAGTGLSDADRDYAERAAAGKITMDERAIRKVLDINDRAARNVIENHNRSVEGIKTNIPLTVEMPTTPAPAPRESGTSVTVNGTTYVFPNAEAAAKFKKAAGVK